MLAGETYVAKLTTAKELPALQKTSKLFIHCLYPQFRDRIVYHLYRLFGEDGNLCITELSTVTSTGLHFRDIFQDSLHDCTTGTTYKQGFTPDTDLRI